jgi:glycine cleavage system H protein
MEYPQGLKYSREHEWVKVEGSTALIGITDFAQDELGDVVYVELPDIGAELEANNTFGVVESVKAVSDLYAPVSGTVTEVNDQLNDEPETVNSAPFEDGWMLRIEMSDPSEMDSLLGADEYKAFVEEESG